MASRHRYLGCLGLLLLALMRSVFAFLCFGLCSNNCIGVLCNVAVQFLRALGSWCLLKHSIWSFVHGAGSFESLLVCGIGLAESFLELRVVWLGLICCWMLHGVKVLLCLSGLERLMQELERDANILFSGRVLRLGC